MILCILVIWTLLAVALGMALGRAIAEADAAEIADDSTWLDDQPTAVLSDAEIARRFDTITYAQRQADVVTWNRQRRVVRRWTA